MITACFSTNASLRNLCSPLPSTSPFSPMGLGAFAGIAAKSPAPYPTRPHAYICHGVHGPCPKKKFDASAANAPTMNPLFLPNTTPAMIATALTGLKSGIGANRIRPAAASAARTTVGMMSRRRGVEDSYVAKNTPSDARTTTSDRSAVWSAFVSAHTTRIAGVAQIDSASKAIRLFAR